VEMENFGVRTPESELKVQVAAKLTCMQQRCWLVSAKWLGATLLLYVVSGYIAKERKTLVCRVCILLVFIVYVPVYSNWIIRTIYFYHLWRVISSQKLPKIELQLRGARCSQINCKPELHRL